MPTVVQDVSGDTALQTAIAALKAKIEGAEESSDIAQAVSQINTALAGKQNTLTFDSAPSSGSSNPVTSGGIKTALDAANDEIGELKKNFNDIQSLTRNLVDIDTIFSNVTGAVKETDEYQFTLKNVVDASIVNLSQKTYTISYDAYNANGVGKTHIVALTIQGVKSDSSIQSLIGNYRDDSAWTHKVYVLDNTGGTFNSLVFSYSNGGNDVWHIKNLQVEEWEAETPYIPYKTANDETARYNFDVMVGGYVTPEMFGAVGDGVTDDTTALTKAVNYGHNVYLNPEKSYYITDTIVINEVVGRLGRVIYSNNAGKWSNDSVIKVGYSNVNKPIFRLKDDGFTFYGLVVKACNTDNSDHSCVFVDTDISAVDVDLTIESCCITSGSTMVKATGRGINIINNTIARFRTVLDLSWAEEIYDGQTDSPYHDYDTGQRAVRFVGNRMHSMYSPSYPVIKINSGRAFGMQIIDNMVDRGECYLIDADSSGGQFPARGKNWIISNNEFHGLGGNAERNKRFIMLAEGIDGLICVGNSFVSSIDSARVANNIIYSDDDVTGIIFSSNSISGISGSVLNIPHNMDKCAIVGNVVTGETQDLIDGNPTMTNVEIVGNCCPT